MTITTKKKLIYAASIVAMLALAGCSETETEKVAGTVDEAPTADVAATDAADSGEVTEDINTVIVDNDKYKATLLNIVKKNDELWGNTIEVVYEVENKTDFTLGVQARSVSADGYMVDETLVSMSQEVAPGKKAKAVLTINELEGYDFPELNNDFEMGLYILNYDTFDTIEEHPVKVSF